MLGRIILAELKKLLASRLGWAGLLFLFVVSAMVTLAVDLVSVNVSEQAGGEPSSLPDAIAWTLRIRNFYLAQVWLLVLSAVSFAGEFSGRTLREDVARAVPRWALLFAKWVGLTAWSGFALFGQTVVTLLFGIGALSTGSGEGWSVAASGLLGTLLADASFVAVALLVAVLTRRVAPAVVATALFIGIERAFAASLFVVKNLDQEVIDLLAPGVPLGQIANAILPYSPANAWAIGTSLATGTEVQTVTYVALASWTILAAGLAALRFERVDVP